MADPTGFIMCEKHKVGHHKSFECFMCMVEREDEARLTDPHYDDFIPGYPTEMDWMNAQEADDYRNEGE